MTADAGIQDTLLSVVPKVHSTLNDKQTLPVPLRSRGLKLLEKEPSLYYTPFINIRIY